MNEPDFLTHAVGYLRRAGASVELLTRFRKTYTGATKAGGHFYPCPLCFLKGNEAEYMTVIPKPPARKILTCESCNYDVTVTSPRL
jgi:hypothetical protein